MDLTLGEETKRVKDSGVIYLPDDELSDAVLFC